MEHLLWLLIVGVAFWAFRIRKPPPIVVPVPEPEPQRLQERPSSAAPPERNADDQLDGRDAWDEEALALYMQGDARSLSNRSLRLWFTDRNGTKTVRDVNTIRYVRTSNEVGGVLWAFCRLRDANRPFRFSGISRAVDLETGEDIQNIGDWLDATYFSRPAGQVERFLDIHGSAVYCLFAIAKGDGVMRPNERKLIMDFAYSKGLTDPQHLDELESQIKRWFGDTRSAFWEAVKATPGEAYPPAAISDLFKLMHSIASLGGLHPEEQRMLNYAAKQWKQPTMRD